MPLTEAYAIATMTLVCDVALAGVALVVIAGVACALWSGRRGRE